MTLADPRRAHWLKTLHQWHWISSAICLVGLLLFALTGLTLNHAASIEARPRVSTQRLQLDFAAAAALQGAQPAHAVLPPALRDVLREHLGLGTEGLDAEWSDDEVYLSLPRPGGDAWLRIDRASGELEYELTDRGWIAYLNDLHKGRHAGAAWSWFIDVFALACGVFALTGLLILKMHAPRRAATWPLVAAGLVLPLLLALLFIH